MIAQMITVALIAIHIVAGTPIYVGDPVEFHVAGFGNATELVLLLGKEGAGTSGIVCERDPKGNKDGHWICPWVASEGRWFVHSITHKNKKGIFEVWTPGYQSAHTILEPVSPDPDPDDGGEVKPPIPGGFELYLPEVCK
jgi:hypothetical protein